MKVIEHAEKRTNREDVRKFHFAESSVRDWKKQKGKLQKSSLWYR